MQEARSRGINATFDEVEDAVQRHVAMIRDQMGGEEAFQRQLVQEGIAYEELLERYREEARRELLYTRLIQREIYSKIEISDAEVQRYFDEHRAELPPKPARVEIAHVFIGLRPEEEDFKAAQAKLEQIGKRMAAGESFESVAREFSQDEASRERGGDLGWFDAGGSRSRGWPASSPVSSPARSPSRSRPRRASRSCGSPSATAPGCTCSTFG